MVELTIQLDEIDYDALLERLLPELRRSGKPAAALAAGMLQKLPDTAKDQVAVELINANREALSSFVEQGAAQYGVPGRVVSVEARAR